MKGAGENRKIGEGIPGPDCKQQALPSYICEEEEAYADSTANADVVQSN